MFIEVIRDPKLWPSLERHLRRGRIWLSAVVAHESLAARLIARRIRLHGSLQPRDHLADVLVLVSAARLHGEVVTTNQGHFRAWARLARAAGLDVTVSATLPRSP
jgi:hypothetical protein